ncbi:hypothetical protein D3C72_2174910 [compost metagenome]
MLCRPCVNLAATGLGESDQAFEQVHAQQAEHRLGAHGGAARAIVLGRCGHGDVGVLGVSRRRQALGQVQGEQRGVAGHCQQPGRFATLQSCQKTR